MREQLLPLTVDSAKKARCQVYAKVQAQVCEQVRDRVAVKKWWRVEERIWQPVYALVGIQVREQVFNEACDHTEQRFGVQRAYMW